MICCCLLLQDVELSLAKASLSVYDKRGVVFALHYLSELYGARASAAIEHTTFSTIISKVIGSDESYQAVYRQLLEEASAEQHRSIEHLVILHFSTLSAVQLADLPEERLQILQVHTTSPLHYAEKKYIRLVMDKLMQYLEIRAANHIQTRSPAALLPLVATIDDFVPLLARISSATSLCDNALF